MKETNPKHWLSGVEGELKIKEVVMEIKPSEEWPRYKLTEGKVRSNIKSADIPGNRPKEPPPAPLLKNNTVAMTKEMSDKAKIKMLAEALKTILEAGAWYDSALEIDTYAPGFLSGRELKEKGWHALRCAGYDKNEEDG
jgi:hypothetical protein